LKIRPINSSAGGQWEFNSDDPAVIEWFSQPEITHTDIIIDQINNGMYSRFVNKPDMTIIDIGANIGLFSIFAHTNCKKLVMVEPSPYNTYISNQLFSATNAANIVVDQCALSGENGTIKLNLHSSPTCNSIVYQTDSDISIDVTTKTIKQLLEDHNLDYVDFIKCDIEGAEMIALTVDTLSEVSNKISSWIVEAHNTSDNEWPGNLKNNLDSLLTIFRQVGYNVEILGHDLFYAYK